MAFAKISIVLSLILSIFGCKPRVDTSALRDADASASAFTKTDFDKLQKFMTAYCADCHGDGGEANFTYAENMPKMADSPIVKKGDAEASRIWQRLAAKSMPPSDASSFPSDDEKDIVRRWIAAGAPVSFGSTGDGRKFLSAADMLNAIAADLQTVPQADRKFTRYLTLRNLYNQRSGGVPLIKDEQLYAFRNGLSFLVNSLHWRPEITPLTTVEGTEGTVLRLNLRKYSSTVNELAALGVKGLAQTSAGWDYSEGYGLTRKAWDALISNDPYKVPYEGGKAKFITQETGNAFPFMRGDIFVFLASRSHDAKKAETFKFSYYRILGIEGNFEDANRAIFGRKIEDQLKAGDTNVIRSGFPDSGVSDHNRLLERHVIQTYQTPGAKEAAYWLSYDFGGSVGNQQLESHPLGPVAAFKSINGGKHVFSHDGGEVIFSLPNGLHAYMLFTSAGVLLAEGPINIVRDKKRIIVFNGISCMDCHKMGMLTKLDRVRESIDQNQDQYTQEEMNILSRLYRDDQQVSLNTQFTYDTNAYLQAKAKTVVDTESFKSAQQYNESISLGIPDLHDLFVSDISAAVAASEVDLDEETFKAKLQTTPELRQILASFLTAGKIVKRETFRDFFPRIVKGLDLAKVDETEVQSTLCQGCTVTCQAQVFTTQGKLLSPKTFDGKSTLSESDAREAALKECNGRLTDGLKASGFSCKVASECVKTGQ